MKLTMNVLVHSPCYQWKKMMHGTVVACQHNKDGDPIDYCIDYPILDLNLLLRQHTLCQF